MTGTTTQTRYERVKQILSAAAAESAVDYGGQGRFWEAPLSQLLTVRVFGVRMIAPEQEAGGSCCGPGRGTASGLILGLRGHAPFDGSRFPRLPWGGQPVAGAAIQFISDWIDDGCPENDQVIGAYDLDAASAEVGLEDISEDNVELAVRAAYAASSPEEYTYRRGELRHRMNLDCMSEGQLEKLRAAFRELYHLNKWPEDPRSYNNLALIHQNHCQHGWERFLPWHRIYLYEFEQALQDQVPDVTLPYWDWTMPQYHPSLPQKGWIIPRAIQAYLTETSIEELKAADPPLPADAAEKLRKKMVEPGKTYASQRRFFDEVDQVIGKKYTKGDHRERFIDALLASNAFWYPLRYPAEYTAQDGSSSTINKVIHYHYPTADDIRQILSLRTFRDFGGGSLYDDAFGFLDQNPHNTMHIWTGGMNPDQGKDAQDFGKDLNYDRNRGVQVAGRQFHTREDLYSQPKFGDMFSNLTASYDPIFWPVHSNVDRLWWEWQQRNPHGVPADLDAVLTPWSYTIHDTLDMHRFGYEYVKSTYIIPVGLAAPVGRFVSRPIGISEAVRAGFRHAEVRLHHVPQLPRSCFIRVFLNLPDANAATPIDHDNYAGYLAIFGHGPCYGGPGHCEPPPPQPRNFDRRPRSHNTPRNHRIDVTACARRLIESSATSLQMTLVVIGADYNEDSELFRLEGISLTFLD